MNLLWCAQLFMNRIGSSFLCGAKEWMWSKNKKQKQFRPYLYRRLRIHDLDIHYTYVYIYTDKDLRVLLSLQTSKNSLRWDTLLNIWFMRRNALYECWWCASIFHQVLSRNQPSGNQFYPVGGSDQNPQITSRSFGQSVERKKVSN